MLTMKQLLLILVYCAGLGLLSGHGDQGGDEKPASATSTAGYQTITSEQARMMMNDGEPYTLVDVRTKAEFQERYIEGARLIPHDEMSRRAETELPDKNARILIYCRSGNRSAGAARKMIDMGYTNVYDFGGILDWPFDIEKE